MSNKEIKATVIAILIIIAMFLIGSFFGYHLDKTIF